MKKHVKRFTAWLLLSVVFVHFAGCGRSGDSIQAFNLMDEIAANDVAEKAPDTRFTDAQMDFALALFKRSARLEDKKNENLLVSPLSVMLALAMTANGAEGDTRAEMENVLGGSMTIGELNEYLYAYVNSLPSDEKCRLKVANSIWFRDAERLQVKESFLQTNADYYGADAYKAAFDENTLRDINTWVEQNTEGMIKEILREIDENAVMYLINALVFEAEWESPYAKGSFHEDAFTAVTGEERTVEMMYSSERCYLEDDNAIGFTKAYKGGKYSFAALLPNEGIDIYDYIDGMTVGSVREILANAQSTEVKARLPRFSYDYAASMKEILAEMGMPTAFSADADFGALGTSETGKIAISEVLHKTYISVDGMGTKAGAVTAVGVEEGAAPMEPKVVKLDRPFVYMIVDNATGLPAFMGAVMDIQ